MGSHERFIRGSGGLSRENRDEEGNETVAENEIVRWRRPVKEALVLLAAVALLAMGAAAQNFTVGTGAGLSIAGPKGPITRGNNIDITISGEPLTGYYLWVSGSSSLSGAPGDQPPQLLAGQVGVSQDLAGGPYTIGAHQVAGGGTIRGAVPAVPLGGTGYYALVTTDEGGSRTVEWATSQETALMTYDIRVERGTGGNVEFDDAEVTVVRGTLNLRVNGQMISAYLGEEVDLTGVNTESDTTYLFVTGPNLPASGGRLDSPRTPVVDSDPSTFTQVGVNTDESWRYRWRTEGLGLDAGVYIIFAVSTPVSFTGLGDTAYGTTSVDLARSPVSGTETTPAVAQGDTFYITGIAAGAQQVAIWIFGTNKLVYGMASANSDGTFSYELSRGVTASLAPGQYVAVVQHPGPLGVFDVSPSADRTAILLTVPPGGAVNIAGLGPTAGSYALISALNSPYIDDTYTSLSFLVENPMVSVDSIGQTLAGRPVVITGTTNLAPGDHLIVNVYSSAFTPTPKTQSGEFYGTSGSVTVQPGPGDLNSWSFLVHTSTFAPGLYLVTVSGVDVPAGDSTSFTLVLAAPTKVPTTLPPTTPITTTTPPPVPTTPAPTTPAPAPLPGFGALAALAGSAGVIILVGRKRRDEPGWRSSPRRSRRPRTPFPRGG